ncbi:hypothetical protein EGW08_011112 [Elysia chlorotica]|uniref:Uncharacterized protein n=1 Tax=Elysia chlorotica TaxID=188477 RepID=A0A3S1HK51_ELYCH|nr:hypothetical protein EGW08_011112 [Elysia chlorotica]
MTPEIDIREEGNSVDPPNLQSALSPHGGLAFSEGLPSSFHDPGSAAAGDLKNAGKFVFESSTTSSRTCYETFSATDGAEKVSTFVLDRGAHTTSISKAEVISSLNESNSASASRRQLGVSGEHFHIITEGTIPDLKLNGESIMGPFEKSGNQRNKVNDIHEDLATVSMHYEQEERAVKPSDEGQENHELRETDERASDLSSTSFNLEQEKLAYRLKPQLTSDFLSQEISSTISKTPINVEEILHKYGLETRKYNSPLRTSKHAQGDTVEGAAITSTVSSYKSFTSCKFVSMSDSKNTQSCNKFQESHTSHIDMSQNNESLVKVKESSSKASHSEGNSLVQVTCTAQIQQSQQIVKTSSPSANTDSTPRGDSSKNNDSQELQSSEEKSQDHAAAELTAFHGSSVDIALNNRSEGTPSNYGLSYSGLRNAPSATAYTSPYSGMAATSGIRSMTSHSSNMDKSPFEGYYLKHHMSLADQPVSKGASAAATPEMITSGPSTAGNSRDSLSTSSSSRTLINGLGSSTDSLDYSLQKERYRLRGIDNMITAGPGRIPRPYSTVPYLSTHTPNNYSMKSSNRYSSSSSFMGSTMPSSTSFSNAPSYGSQTDIATIRRAGSNVDTGQFNNNRGVTDNGYRANMYSSEMAKRLSLQEAWVNEPPGRNANKGTYVDSKLRNNQQKRNLNQEQKKQKVAKNTRSAGAQNIIERNRLAVSQNGTGWGKGIVSTRETTNSQRPKSAQAANSSRPTNQSHNSVAYSEVSRQSKGPMRATASGKDSKKNKSDMSHTGDHNRAKNNCICFNSISAKSKETNGDRGIKSVFNSALNNRRSERFKYQPYHVKVKGKEEKEHCKCQEQLGQIDTASENALSRSCSNISRSRESCVPETEYETDSSQLHSYPRRSKRSSKGKVAVSNCVSEQEICQRTLVTATALASALIHKRQYHPDRLRLFLEDTFPKETRKRDAKAETPNNAGTAESRAIKPRQGVKKLPQKTASGGSRPVSARSCPRADLIRTAAKFSTSLQTTTFSRP